jgi:short-subunit dehydrogenase
VTEDDGAAPVRPLAVITGATAGIGREFCVQLAAEGHDLIVTARHATRLEELREELEGKYRVAVEVFPADLTIDTDVSLLAERLSRSPQLSLLVNNAGFGTRGDLANASPALQEAMLRLHVMAPMRLCQAALPGLLTRRSGAIVNVSSVASFLYSAGNVNYCATKAYLTVFSEGLAAELAGTGVRVQALCPGFTHTEFHQRMGADMGHLPAWMWLTARQVVHSSLRAVKRGWPVVCIPSLRYKLMVLLLRFTPRIVLRRLATMRQRQV